MMVPEITGPEPKENVAGELYDLMVSYSFDQIEEAVRLMYSLARETEILANSWQTPVEFHLAYYPFWRLATKNTRSGFVQVVTGPASLNRLLRDNEKPLARFLDLDMDQQPFFLHRFLLSLEEKRNFEIELLGKGIEACYPEHQGDDGILNGLGFRKSA